MLFKTAYFDIDNFPRLLNSKIPSSEKNMFDSRIVTFMLKQIYGIDIKGPEEFSCSEGWNAALLVSLINFYFPEIEVESRDEFSTAKQYRFYLEDLMGDHDLNDTTEMQSIRTSIDYYTKHIRMSNEYVIKYNENLELDETLPESEKKDPIDFEKIEAFATLYCASLPEDEKEKFNQLRKTFQAQHDLIREKKSILDEMEKNGKSQQYIDLNKKLKNRIKTITPKDYVDDSKLCEEMAPAEPRPLTFCQKATRVAAYATVMLTGLALTATAYTTYSNRNFIG